MAVYVHPETKRYSTESAQVYSSGVHSGIIGHPGTNTYHQSIENLPNQSGYTHYWKNDKSPPGSWSRQYAVGDDLSMNRSDMITDWKRHKAVFDDHSDPRRQYIAEYIGTPDGYTAYRLDFADGSVEQSSADHTWHAHNAPWRKYFNSAEATNARLSVRRGQTKAQYLASIGQGSGEDEDLRTLLGKITGKATVFRGMGMPGTLMALHSDRAYADLRAQGATEYWYGHPHAGDAGTLVDVLGTLPLTTVRDEEEGGYRWETTQENYERSVATVNAAG